MPVAPHEDKVDAAIPEENLQMKVTQMTAASTASVACHGLKVALWPPCEPTMGATLPALQQPAVGPIPRA